VLCLTSAARDVLTLGRSEQSARPPTDSTGVFRHIESRRSGFHVELLSRLLRSMFVPVGMGHDQVKRS
jgi:hypothetical protein